MQDSLKKNCPVLQRKYSPKAAENENKAMPTIFKDINKVYYYGAGKTFTP